jgi:hypothetical protein
VIILCIWGFWRYFRQRNIEGSYWGALIIGELLILSQGILGGVLYFLGLQSERGGMHILYGIIGALGIPAVFFFTKGRKNRKALLVYAAVLFFITGIFFRSIATG